MEKEIPRSGGRGGGSPAGKVTSDRKTVERNRRHRMKGLCTRLFSLLPPLHFSTSKVASLSIEIRVYGDIIIKRAHMVCGIVELRRCKLYLK